MERRKSTDLDDLLDEAPEVPKGHDIRSLGPSDSSDTGADIAADRVVESDEAGLGGGLDQAEEAQLGITDEEVDDIVRSELGLDRADR